MSNISSIEDAEGRRRPSASGRCAISYDCLVRKRSHRGKNPDRPASFLAGWSSRLPDYYFRPERATRSQHSARRAMQPNFPSPTLKAATTCEKRCARICPTRPELGRHPPPHPHLVYRGETSLCKILPRCCGTLKQPRLLDFTQVAEYTTRLDLAAGPYSRSVNLLLGHIINIL